MGFKVGLRVLLVAEATSYWLIATNLMLFEVDERDFMLAESAAGCAAGPTVRCSVFSFDVLFTDRAVVVEVVG